MGKRLHEIRDHLWTVYVTLVSIVVALALENLVGQARSMEALWHWGPGSLLTWLQGSLVFLMALNMWIMSSYLALALRWDIAIRDATGALFFLLMLNGMVAAMGPTAEPAFFWLFGIANGAALVVMLDVFRRAARVPGNGAFLARFRYRRAFTATGFMVLAALASALVLQLGIADRFLATAAAAVIIPLALWILTEFSAAWWLAVDRSARVAEP